MRLFKQLRKGNMKKRITAACVLLGATLLLGTYVKAASAVVSNSTASGQKKVVMTNNGSNGGVFVGRYKFNYTGKCNYYQELGDDSSTWKIDSKKIINEASESRKSAAKKVLGEKITNSTNETLKKQTGSNGNIKAAYLVWQTRQPVGTGKDGQAIAMVDPNGKAHKINAAASIVDRRKAKGAWDYNSIYCLYADVTDIVTGNANGGKGKFGTYTVCNLPIWDLKTSAHTGGGGGSFAVWELVVIEEGNDFPIRACTLSMTSTFSLDDNLDAIDLTIKTSLGDDVKTRANDGKKVSGQLFFAASGKPSNSNSRFVTTFRMYNDAGKKTGEITEKGKIGSEIKSGSSICVYKEEFNNKNFYDSSSATFSLTGQSYVNGAGVTVYPYASVYMLGYGVDVAQPTFSGGQTTTANSDGTVTVSATDGNVIKNTTTKQGNTGYYDGKLVVTLDNALEPIDTNNIVVSYYSAKAKKTATLKGSYSNHVVTFNFKNNEDFINYTNGSYLSYSIPCKVTDQTAAQFNNSHQLSGTLYSRGAKTGVVIDNLHRSESSAKLECYIVHYDGNGGDASNIADMQCKLNVSYQITNDEPTRDGYIFSGYWTDNADGSGNKYIAGSSFSNLAAIGQTKTLYAQWQFETAAYTVKHWKQKLNGTAGVHDETNYELAETEAFTAQVGSVVSPAVKSYTGFKSPAVQQGTVEADGSLVIQYYYDRQSYLVTLYAGTGIKDTSGGGSYLYGKTVNISATLKDGYHWKNWTGTYQTDKQSYSFTMPAQNVTMTANAEANTYTIRFDPNGGMGHIDDIVTTYDTDVTLPDATGIYKKYTLDGVNVTEDVESGAITPGMLVGSKNKETGEDEMIRIEFDDSVYENAETESTDQSTGEPVKPESEEDTETLEELIAEDMTETPETTERPEVAETTETPDETDNTNDRQELLDGSSQDADGERLDKSSDEMQIDGELMDETKKEESVKKVYASVFLGWSLEEDREDLMPKWKAGDVVRNLTAEDNGVVTLYAIWDDCPWIIAEDLYYTLKQAQSGFITEEEILSHATAKDREDGSPILPGVNPAKNNPDVNTSFSIPDYMASEFTSLTSETAISENLTVVDSVGSVYVKQIMIHIVDTTPDIQDQMHLTGVTRFINSKYYAKDFDNGGLEDNSIWKVNGAYRTELEKALNNMDNDTPIERYMIPNETIQQMKAYVEEHGIGNSKEPGALQNFYNQFLAPNKVQ